MKKIYILAIFLIFSCVKKHSNIDTEIFCPESNYKFIVYGKNSQETIAALDRFLAQKEALHTSENYTLLRFLDDTSVQITQLSPEHIKTKCYIHNVSPNMIKSYIRK